MRRRLWSGVLFALALAVQVLAPTAARVVMARSVDSPDAAFAVCLTAAGVSADGRNQSPGPGHAGHDCPLCQVCCSGVAPLQTRPELVGSAPVQQRIAAWTVADCAGPTSQSNVAHRARAPPAFS